MSNITSSPLIPHNVRLIAAVSRIIDLHQSRREAGVYVPEAPERSGYFLTLALQLLEILREMEMERGSSFVPIREIFNILKERVSIVTEEDVDFVIDSLAREREINYGIEDGKGNLNFGVTKDSTLLIEKAKGFAQVQLTENARLLLRISMIKESWLYSDIDAEKLVKAIERGQFSDIPRFCKTMILEIASKNKQLSSALERPTLTELRYMLIEGSTEISDALREATEVVKQASSKIFESETRQRFEHWKISNPVSYSIGNLQTEIEMVMQNVEALSRRFIRFLETALRARSSGGEGIPFLAICESMTNPTSVPDIQRLEAMLAQLMPWGIGAVFFHPSLMVGAVDIIALDTQEKTIPVSTFNLETEYVESHDRFMDFILRNRALVINQLKVCPTTFSEMITNLGFILENGESPADFLGIYAAPEQLDGEGFHIIVGITGEYFDKQIGDSRFSGSDPLMFLMENNL